jgi:glutathione S-transferase
MATLALYQFATSPFCAKVRKILDFKGLDHRVVEVDYLERKELILASGQLMVPALTLESGETIVDSDRIAARLDELYPEPTIFPPEWRGLHLALARYFDSEFEEAMFHVALPDLIAHYASQGRDREAFYRMVRDRANGAGFCNETIANHAKHSVRAQELMAPLDDTLRERAFLLGRIGYADFALYGQLNCLALGGVVKIPAEMTSLRAYYNRVDRITAALDPNA